ncbi:hypothetical protein FJT64_025410 [Amphibalanus amphitrite]|uniref:Uncharacterized protein n=1 Tax=Amphibalanus amphitrite TaxID=1232801 RepID=A0A6A4WFS9_AMPAM|nr:hypothetical protein FJT64_025410 [Amphibalanus amphitrite]
MVILHRSEAAGRLCIYVNTYVTYNYHDHKRGAPHMYLRGWVGPPSRGRQPAPRLHPSGEGGSTAAAGGRPARFLALSFTSLVTVTSTTTSTTYSTDTATTVSVSVLCTAAGMNLETIYCAGG